jgi:hypothetical protein
MREDKLWAECPHSAKWGTQVLNPAESGHSAHKKCSLEARPHPFAMKTSLPSLIMLGAALAANLAAQPNPSPESLSPATLERINGLTPLFDGRTLDGWIQAPPYPLTFSGSDVTDAAALAKKLLAKSDPVSSLLAGQIEERDQPAFAAFAQSGAVSRELTSGLTRTLNRIVNSPASLDAALLAGVKLRPETDALRRGHPAGIELARLNRLLLEDAFPAELSRSPAASWIVTDGAMASTGGGRGVIYTAGDYTHYRLIFTMRHVSGKPDHAPCVLVFGQRPLPGERGLDALGAIQFQPPNGGHWDYRPGHNNGGTGFRRPEPRTRFDSHEWQQVELLVNARTGTARMAVAQPVGTRGVENLTFHDPAAGRTGPIAWQMHNAGLFDEFKDVRIEIDPDDQLLLTAPGL